MLLSQLFCSSFPFSLVGVVVQRIIARRKELEPLLETIMAALVVLVLSVLCLSVYYMLITPPLSPPAYQQDPPTPSCPQFHLLSQPISLKHNKSSKIQHGRGSSLLSSPFPVLSRNSRLGKGGLRLTPTHACCSLLHSLHHQVLCV
ncbi:hypothetical protein BDQ12DRAFT_234301 [Crucibulum laeve]|uniref:Uncharacterized protein n=1 Tax=Crucibulum laeve TaxID=68775 RepID=A0A5C3LDV1_9AGAR|nr:hypothetical protein BDQ12DRAFT_234301 [Crucibulum laeve]